MEETFNNTDMIFFHGFKTSYQQNILLPVMKSQWKGLALS